MVEYQLNFGDKEEYRKVRGKIQEDLKGILGEHCSFLMEVAVNEAVNNAFRYNCLEGNVSIRIRVSDGNRLIIRVKNEGKGFNVKETLDRISDSTIRIFEERLLEESGRGIALMKVATDKLIFNKNGTEVLLMKYINNNWTDNSIKREEVFS